MFFNDSMFNNVQQHNNVPKEHNNNVQQHNNVPKEHKTFPMNYNDLPWSTNLNKCFEYCKDCDVEVEDVLPSEFSSNQHYFHFLVFIGVTRQTEPYFHDQFDSKTIVWMIFRSLALIVPLLHSMDDSDKFKSLARWVDQLMRLNAIEWEKQMKNLLFHLVSVNVFSKRTPKDLKMHAESNIQAFKKLFSFLEFNTSVIDLLQESLKLMNAKECVVMIEIVQDCSPEIRKIKILSNAIREVPFSFVRKKILKILEKCLHSQSSTEYNTCLEICNTIIKAVERDPASSVRVEGLRVIERSSQVFKEIDFLRTAKSLNKKINETNLEIRKQALQLSHELIEENDHWISHLKAALKDSSLEDVLCKIVLDRCNFSGDYFNLFESLSDEECVNLITQLKRFSLRGNKIF